MVAELAEQVNSTFAPSYKTPPKKNTTTRRCQSQTVEVETTVETTTTTKEMGLFLGAHRLAKVEAAPSGSVDDGDNDTDSLHSPQRR